MRGGPRAGRRQRRWARPPPGRRSDKSGRYPPAAIHNSYKKPWLLLETIDQAGDISGAESIVDVDDGYIAGATVQHSEKCGEAVKTCAITDAGRHSDHGARHQSADYARQCAFHAGANHDHSSLGEAFPIAHQAMDAGYADIVNRLDLVAHYFGGNLGFLSHGDVAGAGADHGNFAFAPGGTVAPKANPARSREVFHAWEICHHVLRGVCL